MRYIKFLMFLLSIFISSLSSYGQVMDPPNWEVSVDKEKLEPGDTIVISFQAEVPADWYLYSSDFDPELGPMLTEINFGENQSYEVIGDLIPVDPKEKYDELWGGKYTYFTGIAEFQQRIKIRSSVPKIEAVAIYQICSDVTGQCIPFETDLVWNSKKEDFLQNQSASIKDGNDLISSKELKSFKNEFKIEEKEEGGAFLLTFFFYYPLGPVWQLC